MEQVEKPDEFRKCGDLPKPSPQKIIHHPLWNYPTDSILYVRNKQLFNPKTKRYVTEKDEQSQS